VNKVLSRALWFGCLLLTHFALAAGDPATGTFGPFNMTFPRGGEGLTRPLPDGSAVTAAGAAWTLSTWLKTEAPDDNAALVGGIGDAASGRFLALDASARPTVQINGQTALASSKALTAGEWHFVAASADGQTLSLYVDGRPVGSAKSSQPAVAPMLTLAPRSALISTEGRFGGSVAGFTVHDRALSAHEIAALASARPDFDLIAFVNASPHWPLQVRQQYGMAQPQDPWTLPKARAPISKPVAKPLPDLPALSADGDARWTINGWRLAAAPDVQASAETVSKTGFDDAHWWVATVPGTVLATLVDRGVYPDPEIGLNNMAIPEKLSRQDYWYRTHLRLPADAAGRRLTLSFKGINYSAQVWVNGQAVGRVTGAFMRGVFDVSQQLKADQDNVIAVRISPPPHPGIPHEESLSAGAGENGGMLALDGPTFIATEGWDWIPGVRDRDTGLWQGVQLSASADVTVGDAQVVSTLHDDNREADLDIKVPLVNHASAAVSGELQASFDGVELSQALTLNPGETRVVLQPSMFPQLRVHDPRLWWPNGYGEQALHTLTLRFVSNGVVSDTRRSRFGIREINYELSLMDPAGELRRVAYDPTRARAAGVHAIDGSHTGIRKIPGGWVASLTAAGAASDAITPITDTRLTPYLVIRVNGVRIAIRGGNWGTDDWRKRVSREHLEPFFKLHAHAHENVIRNWLGQNTEDVFYDLADEYGLLILNDFWESTQEVQLEAQDPQLFLANAADVIRRYRGHPSIALWFGRNEGVPQPIINEGLQALIWQLDGTRYYMGSSNTVNLQGSGPYNYREPETYFTTHAKGFSVEVGVPSFPTLEAFEAYVPEPDRWPISDTWAYHDWHADGNGNVASFMQAIKSKFGEADSLPDFERKAQMLNYEVHRAIFEGMNAGLWSQNSGRLLWMSQPAWTSTMWQILSSDYDTQGSYYGTMKGAEPVHVQMNLPDFEVDVINDTVTPLKGLKLRTRVMTLDGTLLKDKQQTLDAGAIAVTRLPRLELPFAEHKVVLVSLALTTTTGQMLSRNDYWQAAAPADLQAMNAMPQTALRLDARLAGDELTVALSNPGTTPAIAAKLTLQDAHGQRILPAYLSDNYLMVLPGETRRVTISADQSLQGGQIALRGWNVQNAVTPIH